MLRFVVQQHFRNEEDWHFDLMLECGDALVTFTSGVAPDETASLPCLVRQVPDHRLAYLEYEGEISGGRGWCRIHDRGTFDWIEPDHLAKAAAKSAAGACVFADHILVRLDGQKATGVYRLTREPKSGTDYWRMRKESNEATKS